MIASNSARASTFRLLGRAGLVALAAVSLAACSHGGKRPKADLAASRITTIGVNSYLWRASLEAVTFMGLVRRTAPAG